MLQDAAARPMQAASSDPRLETLPGKIVSQEDLLRMQRRKPLRFEFRVPSGEAIWDSRQEGCNLKRSNLVSSQEKNESPQSQGLQERNLEEPQGPRRRNTDTF